MAVTTTFFDKIVADIGQSYGIKDGNGQIVENDPIVRLCARLAYQQVVAITGQSFHQTRWLVSYEDVYGPLTLMHSPIETVHSITVDGEEITEYIINNGVLYLSAEVDIDACYSGYTVLTDITAGATAPEEDSILYSAIMFQAVANYNRRDILGFAQVSGERGVTRTPSDRGGLIQAVKELVQPLVYYGNGRVCS